LENLLKNIFPDRNLSFSTSEPMVKVIRRERLPHNGENIMRMKSTFSTLAVAAVLGLSLPVTSAFAALQVGEKAPDFKLSAALAGKPTTFSLQQALKKGPVVLYFFPAAHDFAEATADFAKQGATVIGVTAGNTEQIAKFSQLECRDKFTVAADPGAKVAAEYKNTMNILGKTLSDRTSYVIAPDGKILLSYTDKNPDAHIQKALDAVKKYRQANPA
jgi:peroxiredoxin Q/BCP